MLKFWSLKIHRWVTFIFALPLAAVIITGLIISAEPYLYKQQSGDAALTKEKFAEIRKDFDPENKVRALSYRSYAKELTLQGVGEDGETIINANTGEEVDNESKIVEVMRFSRGFHQNLMTDFGRDIVTYSTFAMMALIVLGLFMGLPRLRNTLGGWHKALAWFLLPLFIISPLSGLFMAYRVTFNPPPARSSVPPPAPIAFWDGVNKLLEKHDATSIIWVRPQGGALAARIVDGNEIKVYRITNEGLTATASNLPRAIHEGTWNVVIGSFLNLLLSFVLVFMLISGLWIWARRRLHLYKAQKKREQNAPA